MADDPIISDPQIMLQDRTGQYKYFGGVDSVVLPLDDGTTKTFTSGGSGGDAHVEYKTGYVETPSYSASVTSKSGDLPTLTVYADIPQSATIVDVRMYTHLYGYAKKDSTLLGASSSSIGTVTSYTSSTVNDMTRITVSSPTDSVIDSWVLSGGANEGRLGKIGILIVVYEI